MCIQFSQMWNVHLVSQILLNGTWTFPYDITIWRWIVSLWWWFCFESCLFQGDAPDVPGTPTNCRPLKGPTKLWQLKHVYMYTIRIYVYTIHVYMYTIHEDLCTKQIRPNVLYKSYRKIDQKFWIKSEVDHWLDWLTVVTILWHGLSHKSIAF